ncbi:hypothetical protein F5Y06DRAFT_307132 [Hypoxylon sp. FL0890]|nr:hypothetical protein F5Y06DRAFT_307132 [Hypoxylon sp. FL0890]
MADFSWLRLGQRSRTPSTPRSPASPEGGPANVPSRLSQASRSSLSPEHLSGSNNAGSLVREQDKIWHNPSLDQMVEALQVKIMTQGTLRPIPIEYNSYILHLIEGFAKAQERIRALDDARAETKYALDYHLHHFKSVADEWIERERQYKVEIKRLEVLLSRTSRDGLEAVTLARTNSVVDRNGPQAKKFASKVNNLSKAPFDLPRKAEKGGFKSIAKILDNDSDFLMSEKIRRNATAARAAMIRPERRRAHHEEGLSPRPARGVLIEDMEAEKPETLSNEAKLRPLFSEDVYGASDRNGKMAIEPEGSIPQEKQARRQLLNNLLDSSSCGLDKMREGADTDGLDSRHLRGLSGFSFFPGDDISSFTGGQPDNETTVGAITRSYDDNGIELGHHKHENAVEGSSDRMNNEPASSFATPLRSWENQWWLNSEKALPQDPSTSSVDTVIRTVEENTAVAAYDDTQNTMDVAPPMPVNGDRNRNFDSMLESTAERATFSPGQRTGNDANKGSASSG